MEKEERDRLEELCKPIVAYLLENKDPYTEVVVTMDFIKIKRDELSIPVLEQKKESDLIDCWGLNLKKKI